MRLHQIYKGHCGHFTGVIQLERIMYYDYVRSGFLYCPTENRVFYFKVGYEMCIEYEDNIIIPEYKDEELMDKSNFMNSEVSVIYKVFYITDEQIQLVTTKPYQEWKNDLHDMEKFCCGFFYYEDLKKTFNSFASGGLEYLKYSPSCSEN